MNRFWMPQIDTTRCTGCGECVRRCPENALARVSGKAALVRPEQCVYCRVCEEICPVNAIELPFLIIKVTKEKSDENSGQS